jgi:hypothetical protein
MKMKLLLFPLPEMPRPRSDSLFQDEPAAKRPHIDDPEASLSHTAVAEGSFVPQLPSVPVHLSLSTAEGSFTHRIVLDGRATINNAADTRHFMKHKSLVFHFLDVSGVVENDLGQLVSCKLRCGICGRGNWQWVKAGKAKGSTSNMVNHMKEKHGTLWRAAERSDKAAQGIIHTDSTASDTTPVLPVATNPVCYICT